MSLDLNKVVRLLAAGNIPSPRLEARGIAGTCRRPFAEVDGEAEQKIAAAGRTAAGACAVGQTAWPS